MKTRSAKARNLSGTCLRPLIKYRQAKTAEEYLNQRLNKTETCWLWTIGVDKNGYGQSHANPWGRITQTTRAHQLAYVTWVGPIPPGKIVCHTCDIPQCCNPSHLYAGTYKDNVQDAIRRGRYSNGSKYYPKQKK